jgi:hypothetical protein
MTNTIKELTFEQFEKIVAAIRMLGEQILSEKEITGEDEVNEFLVSKLQKFFPELTPLQEIEFNTLVRELTEENYNDFVAKYPDIHVDPTGKSTPKKKEYWELLADSIEKIYETATQKEEKIPADYQVISAFSLDFLKKKKYQAYLLTRKMLCEKMNYEKTVFETYEQALLKKFSKEETNVFMGQVTGYLWDNRKTLKSKSILVENFMARLECFSLAPDSEKNAEFVKNIAAVIQQYFIKEDKTEA